MEKLIISIQFNNFYNNPARNNQEMLRISFDELKKNLKPGSYNQDNLNELHDQFNKFDIKSYS